jgi:serine protease AprX
MNSPKPFTVCLVVILAVSLIAPGLTTSASSFPPPALSNTGNQQTSYDFTLDLGGMLFDPLQTAPSFPRGWQPTGETGPNLRLVQLIGPIQDSWLEGLRQAGLEIVQYIHPFTYIVWGTQAELNNAGRSSFVRWTGDFSPAYKVLPQWRGLDDTPVDVIIILYNGADHLEIIREISLSLEGVFTGLSDNDPAFIFAGFRLPGSRFLEAARIPGVYSIQPVPSDGGTRGEMSNQINAGNYDDNNLAYPGYAVWLDLIGLDGDGVVMANVDTGVLETHPDLIYQFLPCSGSTCGGSASSSHGTHTAAIMVGTGASGVVDSYGFLRGQGVAPGAKMVEQLYHPTYTQPGGMLKLMTESHRNGALLSGNSWGPSGFPLGYDNNTRQVDVGVRDADPDEPGNQEFSYVLSIMNGNGGTSSQGTPDEAKNIFTIGSTKMQTSGGAQILDINDLSSNTAHGPALDSRKIPHIVAPGCQVDSATIGNGYTLMCGTSMASPHASGAVALFIEYYRNQFEIDPSPAMIKAAFLPVAHSLAGYRDANGNILGHPFDSKQGWGRMNLPPVLNPEVSVRYFDNPLIFDNTGETWTETISPADPTQPVRLMLVWTDAPGHGLGGSTPAWNNNLDLSVEYQGQTYYGNVFDSQGWSTSGGAPDDRNNTEGIFLGPAVSGQISVTVTAANITSDGVPGYGDETDQDFALVCYNCALEPDFTLGINPTSADMCGTGQSEFIVSVGSIMDYDDPVTLSIEGLPGGTGASFGANPVVPPDESLLTLTNSSASPDNYILSLFGEADDRSHSLDFSWNIYTENPSVPVLLLPVNNAANQPLKPTFVWQASDQGGTYRLQVAADIGFADIIVDVEGIRDTAYTLVSELETGTRYFWRVQASNACGIGDFSPAFRFTTEAAPGNCGPDSEAVVIHESSFEDGADGWSAVGGVQNLWALSTARPYSGIYSFFGPNPASVSDQRLHSPEITLPGLDQAPLSFSFWNWHAFENNSTCYDGGLLEITTDGGANWNQVPNSAMLTQPYNGTVALGYQNPLAGKQAWCFSRDWTRAVVDLNAYAEETIQLRFRIGTDSIVAATGWYVDDVRVKSCQASLLFDVYLEPEEAVGFGNPGETVDYNLTLTNLGSEGDTFSFTVESGWAVSLPEPVTLLPNEWEMVTISVSIPEEAQLGDFDLAQVKVTSAGDPFVQAHSTLTTYVIDYSFFLQHGLLEQAGLPGTELTFDFTLINTGNLPALFGLELETSWDASMPDSIQLNPGDEESFNILLPIPMDAPIGETISHILKVINTSNPTFWEEMELRVDVLIPNRPPIVANPIEDQTARVGQAFEFTIPEDIFEDPDGDLLTYSASLEGGEDLLQWLEFDHDTRTFSGIPLEEGTLTIEVTASDGEYQTATSFDLVISDNKAPRVANPIEDQTARVGQAFGFTIPEDTFEDPDGDLLTYSASLEGGEALPQWLSFNPETGTFSGEPLEAGSYHIKVSASDGEYEITARFNLEVLQFTSLYLPFVIR